MARAQATRKRAPAARRDRPPKANRRRRARAPKLRPGGFSIWLSRHAQSLFGSLGRLARHPLNTGMTMAVIGIALALPALLHLAVDNVRGLTGDWRETVELSVYLQPGASADAAEQLAAELAARADVANTTVTLADDALDDFGSWSGLGPALEAMGENPLPHLVTVQPADGYVTASDVARLAEEASALVGVDQVVADTEWVRRLHGMLAVGERLALLAAGVLAVAVLLIVGNTIRLDIQNRSQEIEVQKLVGGSDGFIRRPFLYAGAWYGLGGALIALVIVHGALWSLSGPVARLAGLYGSGFRLSGPDLEGTAAVLAGSVLLGWLGSGVAAARSMRRIEPGQD